MKMEEISKIKIKHLIKFNHLDKKLISIDPSLIGGYVYQEKKYREPRLKYKENIRAKFINDFISEFCFILTENEENFNGSVDFYQVNQDPDKMDQNSKQIYMSRVK